jgi:hypothetical protein
LIKQFQNNQTESIPEKIAPKENLERYLVNRKHFNTTGAKGLAFMPRKTANNDNYTTSVFRTQKMTNEESLHMRKIFENNCSQKIKASAFLSLEDIEFKTDQCGSLKVIPEESKHKWHADITNWPVEKHLRMALSLELAIASTFEKVPPSSTISEDVTVRFRK